MESCEVRFSDGSCCLIDPEDSEEVTFLDLHLPAHLSITPDNFFPGLVSPFFRKRNKKGALFHFSFLSHSGFLLH